MLIAPAELLAQLHHPDWAIFDCRHDLTDHARGARVYAEAHIPSAHFAGIETDLSGRKSGTNGRHPLPDPTEFAAFLARAGVTPATTVVAYDDSGSAYASRLWWLVRWIGHERALVLDGGLTAWLQLGLPTTRETPLPRASAAPYPARPGAMPVLTAEDVVANIATQRIVLLDARAGERFRGESEPIDPLAGHIPGARNRFHRTNLGPDLHFRPRDELRAEFLALLGERPTGELGHYCGSGVTACLNLFAMELAGLTGSQLYAGSWSEWAAMQRAPVATGPG